MFFLSPLPISSFSYIYNPTLNPSKFLTLYYISLTQLNPYSFLVFHLKNLPWDLAISTFVHKLILILLKSVFFFFFEKKKLFASIFLQMTCMYVTIS